MRAWCRVPVTFLATTICSPVPVAAVVIGLLIGCLDHGQTVAQGTATTPQSAESGVVRLPPVEWPGSASPAQYCTPVEDPFGDRAAALPQPSVGVPLFSQPWACGQSDALPPIPNGSPEAPAVEQDPDMPRGSRQGVFQKVTLTDTWLARTGLSGFGMNDAELTTVWGVPCPTRSWPLVITPGFAVHNLDGPAGAGLPPRVYDAYTEFRWIPRFCSQFRADVAVTPGVYSDFEHSNSHALRITGYGSGIWTWCPQLKIVLGAAYLDRRDVSVLPIGGFIWKPSEETEFRLVFPQPKIARRIYWTGAYLPDVENWVYVSGELGGGIWAFQRPDATEDVFSYRDYRLMLGLERKVIGGLSSLFEVGYVFGRKIEFDSTGARIYPTDTVLLRGGLRY